MASDLNNLAQLRTTSSNSPLPPLPLDDRDRGFPSGSNVALATPNGIPPTSSAAALAMGMGNGSGALGATGRYTPTSQMRRTGGLGGGVGYGASQQQQQEWGRGGMASDRDVEREMIEGGRREHPEARRRKGGLLEALFCCRA